MFCDLHPHVFMNSFLRVPCITAVVIALLYSQGERKESFIKPHLQALGNDWVSRTTRSTDLK